MEADDELMQRYARGDAAAFDVLYERHKAAVYRYCLRQLPRDVADEAHQEVWMALIKARARYVPQGQFKSWLFTLAHNTMLNRARAEMKHADPNEQDVAQDNWVPEQEQDQQALSQRLLRLIRGLPHHQRDALMLQYEGGFSLDDIAQITATSKEGVKSRLRYAMSKLRAQMGGEAT